MSKVVLSDALHALFEHFADFDGKEVTLGPEEVAELTSAFGEMADCALELETAVRSGHSAPARQGLAASAVTVGRNVILFPIVPRQPMPAA